MIHTSMLDKFKKLLYKNKTQQAATAEPAQKKQRKPRKKREVPPQPSLSAKELATQNGEPYIGILSVELDPKDPSMATGAFELDWNDKFVVNLIKAGYKIRPNDSDQDIVERWYQTISRNIALELYEQYAADPENRSEMRVIRSRDIGDGRSEIS